MSGRRRILSNIAASTRSSILITSSSERLDATGSLAVVTIAAVVKIDIALLNLVIREAWNTSPSALERHSAWCRLIVTRLVVRYLIWIWYAKFES